MKTKFSVLISFILMLFISCNEDKIGYSLKNLSIFNSEDDFYSYEYVENNDGILYEVKTGTEPKTDVQKAEEKKQSELEAYTAGTIYTIFVHPLIIEPKLAFDGDRNQSYMYDWFVTSTEFKAALNELYKRNYILIKSTDIYNYDEKTGKIYPKQLYLPKGKKPLVFSIDDLNYYPTMKNNGTAQCLYIDDEGNLADKKKIKGGFENDYGESIFILEDFIEEHPDFSYKGARGIIALTGYKGILGYDTQKGAKNIESEKKKALMVAQKIKDMGWEFASHSYAHVYCNNVSASKMNADCKKWDEEVRPLIGKTCIFIYPFGAEANSANLKVLKENGFRFFLGVAGGTSTLIEENYVRLRRRALDGVMFKYRSKNDFVDIDVVFKKPRK
ncbi:MAG: polysaccharide deacetylase family protein [Treponema sp.]|nr:polysaccharide deacetylase family protein [Treponema sp.]